ncbi:MAG: type III polyketide synthase [Bacteroidia bacterium]|nr:type III polyketide synthase [Bacteroidia bacterium]
MSYITSIGTAVPPNKFSQPTIAEFMVRAMQLSGDDERKLRALFRATGIESRHSVLDDYGKQDGFKFYSNTKNLEPFPSTKRRLDVFRQHALDLSLQAVSTCLPKAVTMNSITHLIVVSCTGMYAPGLDIDLVKSLKLNSNIHRTCINFMGCYASFNAIKLADTFCQSQSNAKVLVVCTELCTLHFQKENTENNMLANALFADGAAALLIESKPRQGLNLVPESFYCDIASDGEQDMAWSIGDVGFEMQLSSYVPEAIRKGIGQLTTSLLSNISQKLSDIHFFAIHPGGKKIVEAIEQELGIEKEKNQFAYAVLKKFGNMSSPTVLFVLNELLNSLHSGDDGKRILSFAFGPGLTLESMILKIENH